MTNTPKEEKKWGNPTCDCQSNLGEKCPICTSPTPTASWEEEGMNKCEELKIQHAWREGSEMYGFQTISTQTCANCGLIRRLHSETKKWWSYSDGRQDQQISDIPTTESIIRLL